MKFKIDCDIRNSSYHVVVSNQTNSRWQTVADSGVNSTALNNIFNTFIKLNDQMSFDFICNQPPVYNSSTSYSRSLHHSSLEVDVSSENITFEQSKIKEQIDEEDDETNAVLNTAIQEKTFSKIEDFNPALQPVVREKLLEMGKLLRQLTPVSSVPVQAAQPAVGEPAPKLIHVKPPEVRMQVITISPRRVLNQVIGDITNGLKPVSALKEYVTNVVAKQPELYSNCAAFMYHNDHHGWEQTPKEHRLDEPGTKEFVHNSVRYPKEKYGEYRLQGASAQELLSILSRLP